MDIDFLVLKSYNNNIQNVCFVENTFYLAKWKCLFVLGNKNVLIHIINWINALDYDYF